MIRLRWGAATDTGRVRTVNEDSVLAVEGVFAVADGMGGHAAGEVASSIARDTVREALGHGVATVATVTEAVRAANDAVLRRSVEEPAARGMGTTLTLIAPSTGDDGVDHLIVANVGDSRAYLFAEGQLRQLTRDHSYVEEMLAAGQITEAEAKTHPHRHVVTRALGVEQAVAVDTWLVTPEPGDRYLLCSDGLVNEVDDDHLGALLHERPDPQEAAEALVAAANASGGRDNITVVVVDVLDASGHGSGRAEVAAAKVQEQVGGWLPQELSTGFDTTDPPPPTSPATEAVGAPPPGKAKRRLVTVRSILFVALVVGVFVAAFAVTAAFGRNGFYVGFDGDEVVVFQGRPGGVLWFQPTVEFVSDISRDDLPADVRARVERNPSFSSQGAAQRYITELGPADSGVVVEVTTTIADRDSTATFSATTAVP